MTQDISKEAEHEEQHRHCNVESRTIFCHDNLEVLQGINSECIDLIYLDPPFNKKKIFTAPIGSSAKGASFKDIFTKEDLKDEWVLTIKEDYYAIHELLNAVKNIEGRTSYNFCYLAYMAIRLIECHRVLKDTGSIYLHCDPTMSHYLKLLMDCIFGEKNFKNEIVWRKYAGRKNNATKKFTTQSDSLLFYAKDTNKIKFVTVFITHSTEEIHKKYKYIDEEGRKYRLSWGRNYQLKRAQKKLYLDESKGRAVGNLWTEDDLQLNTSTKERTGYPTQKPLALLERIIKASSNEGDMVLDPFCGCATTCVAAERLGRRWIGVDISHKAYELVQKRIDAESYEGGGLIKGAEGYSPPIHYHTDPPTRANGTQEVQDGKYVYVISHKKWTGEYKVGIASNYDNRLKSYQTSDPNREYQLEHYKLTPRYRELERHIHEVFNNKHEWVQGDLKDIIDEIEKYDM